MPRHITIVVPDDRISQEAARVVSTTLTTVVTPDADFVPVGRLSDHARPRSLYTASSVEIVRAS
jgi:hypothetical protein